MFGKLVKLIILYEYKQNFNFRDLFYVRNHLPVPEIDLKTYVVEIAVEEDTKKTLDFEAIKNYPKYTVTSAIMCGGNRRSEMAEVFLY